MAAPDPSGTMLAAQAHPEPGLVWCSAIVPIHERASVARQCINALLASGAGDGVEVIVVDDGASEAVRRLLAGYGGAIRAVARERGGGFAAACNDGAAAARGEWLAFLPPDLLPTPGWLEALRGCVARHPEAAMAGSRLLAADDTVEHAGVAIGQDGLPRALYGGFSGDHPAAGHERPVRAVWAAGALVRRAAFEQVGGFDAAFRGSLAGVDLCLRLGERGHAVWYCPDSSLRRLGVGGDEAGAARERDEPLYRSRWGHRVRPDDLDHYFEDGLLLVDYDDSRPVRFSVSPLLERRDGAAERPIDVDGPPDELRAGEDPAWQGLIEDRDRLRAELASYQLPTFMHVPLRARSAPAIILEPDPMSDRTTRIVRRVIEAYRRAIGDQRPAAPSMWDYIESTNAAFLSALRDGDVDAVQRALARMFQSSLIWGLGKVHEDHPQMIREHPHGSPTQLHTTDGLVSLAEAVCAARLTSLEQQGVEAHLDALNVDLDGMLTDVEQKAGLDLSFPSVGAAYGCMVAKKFVTPDSVGHSYTVHRLRQLGATPSSSIVEIGGGYGCLGFLAHRAGFDDYRIVDLPWVNVLQGYFLAMATDSGFVRLYGEANGGLQVLPYWCFSALPDASIDYIINTDSLPEMGKATVEQYIKDIRRVLRGYFISINQEGKKPFGDVGPQNWVAEIVDAQGGLRRVHRSRSWMRQGYVEEIYTVER